jgi:hypothetical protein
MASAYMRIDNPPYMVYAEVRLSPNRNEALKFPAPPAKIGARGGTFSALKR